jgi:hypothetical protein
VTSHLTRSRIQKLVGMVLVTICLGHQVPASSLDPYEATVALDAVLSKRSNLAELAIHVATNLGYSRNDARGSKYVVARGYIRLMTFQLTQCRELAGFKCPRDSSRVPDRLVFLEKESASGIIVVRAMQWCGSSCDSLVSATAKAFADGMGAANQG